MENNIDRDVNATRWKMKTAIAFMGRTITRENAQR